MAVFPEAEVLLAAGELREDGEKLSPLTIYTKKTFSHSSNSTFHISNFL